jgi:hypothetical protein
MLYQVLFSNENFYSLVPSSLIVWSLWPCDGHWAFIVVVRSLPPCSTWTVEPNSCRLSINDWPWWNKSDSLTVAQATLNPTTKFARMYVWTFWCLIRLKKGFNCPFWQYFLMLFLFFYTGWPNINKSWRILSCWRLKGWREKVGKDIWMLNLLSFLFVSSHWLELMFGVVAYNFLVSSNEVIIEKL